MEQTREVLRLIDNLRARGKTLIIISHNLAQIFEIADQISVMFHGEMIGSRRVKDTPFSQSPLIQKGFCPSLWSTHGYLYFKETDVEFEVKPNAPVEGYVLRLNP